MAYLKTLCNTFYCDSAKKYYLMSSISKFNHSRDCNVLHTKYHNSSNLFMLVAAYDIEPEEELTIFYNDCAYEFETGI